MSLFFPKILLFGEYAVMRGSGALSIPFQDYQGRLILPASIQHSESNRELKSFFSYLKRDKIFSDYLEHFDITSFQFELNQGLFFDSTIPQGYGVGSSGAVTAAVFERYSSKELKKQLSQQQLLRCFSTMESHFHGKSSGFDPLISYLNHPILFKDGNPREFVAPEESPDGKQAFFLLDTGKSRRTEALVNLFLEKIKVRSFRKNIDGPYVELTNQCIDRFQQQEFEELKKSFYQLSEFQYQAFLPMIPKTYRERWRLGLKTQQNMLKLCGAGGGGFLMGFTSDLRSMSDWSHEQVRVLLKF